MTVYHDARGWIHEATPLVACNSGRPRIHETRSTAKYIHEEHEVNTLCITLWPANTARLTISREDTYTNRNRGALAMSVMGGAVLQVAGRIHILPILPTSAPPALPNGAHWRVQRRPRGAEASVPAPDQTIRHPGVVVSTVVLHRVRRRSARHGPHGGYSF